MSAPRGRGKRRENYLGSDLILVHWVNSNFGGKNAIHHSPELPGAQVPFMLYPWLLYRSMVQLDQGLRNRYYKDLLFSDVNLYHDPWLVLYEQSSGFNSPCGPEFLRQEHRAFSPACLRETRGAFLGRIHAEPRPLKHDMEGVKRCLDPNLVKKHATLVIVIQTQAGAPSLNHEATPLEKTVWVYFNVLG
ncbi:hypothetical protein BD779DRAFT_1472815 [Infundibulicybe gibba]|nr:hypothetical protein BD779DRAFT_1472815 [Infundibulicybe gibba]